ncbi:hypothetical protein DSO57_1030857 [Entomophthora muscae]|uniref:Uncharacterized protein n=1 Tax=Entomophthora muscae TaxID=34485 RepID=A0ACC2TN79_9FUNG|nr:hypothetical protein DSO57_1030857 [Entomophthora muscae]
MILHIPSSVSGHNISNLPSCIGLSENLLELSIALLASSLALLLLYLDFQNFFDLLIVASILFLLAISHQSYISLPKLLRTLADDSLLTLTGQSDSELDTMPAMFQRLF